jgi:general L-amino acid transport system substrate-binding protein
MPSRGPKFKVVLSLIAFVLAMHEPAAAQKAADSGIGLMVRKVLGLKSARELSGAALCMQDRAETNQHIQTYFSKNGMEYRPLLFSIREEVFAAYNDNRCDAVVANASELSAARLMLKNPDDHVVLPERLSPD